jgi:hypothetical protein
MPCRSTGYVEVFLCLFLTSAIEESGWSTLRPGHFNLWTGPPYPEYERMGGPQGRSARIWRKKNALSPCTVPYLFVRRQNLICDIFVLPFLGALARLRNATTNFVISVRPSARNKSAPTWRIFIKFWYMGDFSKICRENSSLLKSDKNKVRIKIGQE